MAAYGQYNDSIRRDNILILPSPETKARAEAAYTRRIIRKSDFTRAERDVLIALVNLWFYHRNGRNGFIHPGRELLAKKAKASIRTVAAALATFRDLDFIVAQKYATGGTGCATQYGVNLRVIWQFLDPDRVLVMPGELHLIRRETVQSSGTNCTVCGDRNCTVSACENCTLSYMTDASSFDGENPSQDDDNGGAA